MSARHSLTDRLRRLAQTRFSETGLVFQARPRLGLAWVAPTALPASCDDLWQRELTSGHGMDPRNGRSGWERKLRVCAVGLGACERFPIRGRFDARLRSVVVPGDEMGRSERAEVGALQRVHVLPRRLLARTSHRCAKRGRGDASKDKARDSSGAQAHSGYVDRFAGSEWSRTQCARRVRNMDGAQQRNRIGGPAGFAGLSVDR